MAATHMDELTATGFASLAGTPAEVCRRLEKLDVEQVVVLTLKHGSPKVAQVLTEAVVSIAPLILTALTKREQQTLAKMMEVLVPHVPVPQHLLVEARMNAEACRAILESAAWLTAAEVAQIAGFLSQKWSSFTFFMVPKTIVRSSSRPEPPAFRAFPAFGRVPPLH